MSRAGKLSVFNETYRRVIQLLRKTGLLESDEIPELIGPVQLRGWSGEIYKEGKNTFWGYMVKVHIRKPKNGTNEVWLTFNRGIVSLGISTDGKTSEYVDNLYTLKQSIKKPGFSKLG